MNATLSTVKSFDVCRIQKVRIGVLKKSILKNRQKKSTVSKGQQKSEMQVEARRCDCPPSQCSGVGEFRSQAAYQIISHRNTPFLMGGDESSCPRSLQVFIQFGHVASQGQFSDTLHTCTVNYPYSIIFISAVREYSQ